ILFDRGDEVAVQAGDDGIRFLLVSGKPLQEPVAWYGPIVMNTQEQLQQAYDELQAGAFFKQGKILWRGTYGEKACRGRVAAGSRGGPGSKAARTRGAWVCIRLCSAAPCNPCPPPRPADP